MQNLFFKLEQTGTKDNVIVFADVNVNHMRLLLDMIYMQSVSIGENDIIGVMRLTRKLQMEIEVTQAVFHVDSSLDPEVKEAPKVTVNKAQQIVEVKSASLENQPAPKIQPAPQIHKAPETLPAPQIHKALETQPAPQIKESPKNQFVQKIHEASKIQPIPNVQGTKVKPDTQVASKRAKINKQQVTVELPVNLAARPRRSRLRASTPPRQTENADKKSRKRRSGSQLPLSVTLKENKPGDSKYRRTSVCLANNLNTNFNSKNIGQKFNAYTTVLQEILIGQKM